MEEVDAPPSDVPGEKLSTRQVLPSLPPPFTRQRFTEDLITRRTPEAERAVREKWQSLRKGGEFDPPSTQGTILFPGMDGGGEWGGAAYDAGTGLFYVNANEMAWTVRLKERPMPDGEPQTGKALYARYCASCHRADRRGTPPELPSLVDISQRRSVDEIAAVVRDGAGRMPGYAHLHAAVRRALVQYVASGRSDTVRQDAPSPFDVRYTLDGDIRFTDPEGFPAVTPPWGTLTAIDMNKAAIAWQVPLGETPGSGLEATGCENYGGPVVTASGLVFIGATICDKAFRAFDARTGALLWQATLPAAGNSTPAVYEVEREAVRGDRRRRGQVGCAQRGNVRGLRAAGRLDFGLHAARPPVAGSSFRRRPPGCGAGLRGPARSTRLRGRGQAERRRSTCASARSTSTSTPASTSRVSARSSTPRSSRRPWSARASTRSRASPAATTATSITTPRRSRRGITRTSRATCSESRSRPVTNETSAFRYT